MSEKIIKENVQELNADQIKRLYDVFDFDENEEIETARLENGELFITYRDADDILGDYEPSLDGEEGKQKLDYILNGDKDTSNSTKLKEDSSSTPQVFDISYDRQPWGTWVKIDTSDGVKKGTVSIPKNLKYDELGDAIKQLLNTKYGYKVPIKNSNVLDNDTLNKSEIKWDDKMTEAKREIKEDYGNVNATKLANFIKNAVESLKKDGDSTWYFHLVDNLYYVIGGVNPANYDTEDLENFATDEEGWVICGKIAVNVDDLQSDYEFDWYMPFEREGETWNTEREFYNDEDYNSVAQDVIYELQGFEGVVVGDDGEISPEYDRRAVEQEYDLEDGELDGVSIRNAEGIIGTEEGELDRFIIQRESCKKGKGKKKLKEKKSCKPKRTLKEEVSDEAYQVAEIIDNTWSGEDFISFDDFEETFALAIRQVFGIDNVWDNVDEPLPNGDDVMQFENEVRGILAFNGWETQYESDDEGGLVQLNAEQPSESKIIYDALVEYERTHWDSIGKLEQRKLNELITKYDEKVGLGESCKRGKIKKKVNESLTITIDEEDALDLLMNRLKN